MKSTLIPALMFLAATAAAQPSDSKNQYRAEAEKHFDLVHTKLAVTFDYAKRRMPAQAWITLRPHFYEQDTLVLDAVGMFINRVGLVQGTGMQQLSFSYTDSLHLKIALGKKFNRNQNLTVYIDYVARPDEISAKGSAAIRAAKGLYFINPDGKDSTKPIQIWTQGETQATSVWCPTIDRPNQKTTQEIAMTVPAKYVTLSNGLLTAQKKNANGTRTDTWKMDQPHAPYLFFMGVGDFAVVKDQYKALPLTYYVERKWEPYAKGIFGLTPQMIATYERLLGVPYPWKKYAQMVGRDYVSGAMENTTATLHGSGAYQNARQLVDGNRWETTVAHELFHQWFGDLVTAESWSNLTVNESFADYSEYLWLEAKYGRDKADEDHWQGMNGYLRGQNNSAKHLVRFYYNDKEDMFDAVSYQKGGRVLHMLRHYLGDSAFFKGLNLFLAQNRFKAAEAHQLRLALEEVSGRDLNWFFNQWYFGSGHPVVTIDQAYDAEKKEVHVYLKQTQEGTKFSMPLAIDIYAAGNRTRHNVWMQSTTDTFRLPCTTTPDLVNVDAEKIMLWRKTDNKPAAQWYNQYVLARNYYDRREALDWTAAHYDSSALLRSLMAKALSDPFEGLRQQAIRFWGGRNQLLSAAEWQTLESIARSDKDRRTRAAAIDVLAKKASPAYQALFEKGLTDSSYTVAGASLEALLLLNPDLVKNKTADLKKDAEGRLGQALQTAALQQRTPAEWEQVVAEYKKQNMMQRNQQNKGMILYAAKLSDTTAFRQVVGPAIEYAKGTSPDFGGMRAGTVDMLGWLLEEKRRQLAAKPGDAMLTAQVRYLDEKMRK